MKKEAQAKETRKKIINAAVRLFARYGYHRTTIADLAQAVEMTSGAVFYHFQSKEALLDVVIDWLARGIRVYSNYSDRAENGSVKVVEDVLVIMCEHFHRNPEATICLAALATEFAGSNHPLEIRLKETYEVFVNSFTRILENHPKVADPRAAAIAFVGSVQGIAIQGLLRKNDITIDELAKNFLTLFTHW